MPAFPLGFFFISFTPSTFTPSVHTNKRNNIRYEQHRDFISHPLRFNRQFNAWIATVWICNLTRVSFVIELILCVTLNADVQNLCICVSVCVFSVQSNIQVKNGIFNRQMIIMSIVQLFIAKTIIKSYARTEKSHIENHESNKFESVWETNKGVSCGEKN